MDDRKGIPTVRYGEYELSNNLINNILEVFLCITGAIIITLGTVIIFSEFDNFKILFGLLIPLGMMLIIIPISEIRKRQLQSFSSGIGK